METNNLGNKKFNNEQQVNEGFSGENIAENYNPSLGKLKPEEEIDQDGNHKLVQRADLSDDQSRRKWNESELRGVEDDKATQKMVEHKDRNSDIASNRYPNAHPDNHTDRGNIKLDE